MDAYKPVKKIDACYMNLQIGQPAYVGMNGMIMETSPVQRYNVSAGRVYIETQNTVYTNMDLSVRKTIDSMKEKNVVQVMDSNYNMRM